MSDQGHDPLTPEERAIAQRLARLDSASAPSPELDTRIRSTARASVSPGNAADGRLRRRGRTMRWPVGIGVAASLALAVGVAWQLRPLTDTHIQYSEAPIAVAAQQLDPPDSDTGTVDDAGKSVATEAPMGTDATARRLGATSTTEPDARGEVAAATKPEPRPELEAASEAAARPIAEPEAGNVVHDAPARIRPPETPPAPPPPAPAPAPTEQGVIRARQAAVSPADAATVKDAEQSISERKVRARRSDAFAGEEAAARAKAEAQVRTQAAQSRNEGAEADESSDLIFDDAPPASVDSPEVRAAWLARIRELVAEGYLNDARASLQEFLRRYPGTQVPNDLRPLLERP